MRSFTFILFSFVLISCSLHAQLIGEVIQTKRTSYLSDNKKQTPLDSLIDRTIVDFMQSPQNSGLSIGIIKDSLVYFYNYGETKRNNSTLPNKNTLFELGSVTKTFCGILLANAVIEGKIKLEDDIRLYLPGRYPNLETKKQFIHVKDLANHTSGLPRIPDDLKFQTNYDSLNPYKNYNKKMMLAYLKTITLSTEPGQIFDYSNYGMALLGIILEEIYKKPFEELIKEKIWMPNLMNSTTITLNTEQAQLLADGYDGFGDPVPHWDLGGFTAAGAIISSTADMISYLKYNISEKDEITRLAHRSTFNYSSNMALGWHIVKTKFTNELIWHNGGTFGFSGFCGFIKEKRTGLIVLSNSATNVDFIALAILRFLQQ